MKHKRFLAMICAFACMVSVSSCGLTLTEEDDDTEETTAAAAETTAAGETTTAAGETTTAAGETTTAAGETTTAAGETTTAAADTTTADTGDWTTYQFTYNGTTIQLPMALTEFVTAVGGSIAWGDYTYYDDNDSRVTMNGEETDVSGYGYYVTFENLSEYFLTVDLNVDGTKMIKECDVFGVRFNITGVGAGESYPEVVLPGGVTWFYTEDQIKAVYGEPYETYESDDYVTMTYTKTSGDKLELTVYDNGGLKKIDETVPKE